jgi:putative transposase
MYDWRKMTARERFNTLLDRRHRLKPWHSPPHRYLPGNRRYSISAACYEHAPVIATSAERLDAFTNELLDICRRVGTGIYAWCVLPNHYHIAVATDDLRSFLKSLALLHGRTSHAWNGQDQQRGRKVWCNYIDREMRSEAHLYATINYVRNNPVKHDYVERWQDWPWSSAEQYLKEMGRTAALQRWEEFGPDRFQELVDLPF